MSESSGSSLQRRLSAFSEWAGRVRLRARLAIALTIASCAAGIATYAAITETPPFGQDPSLLTSLLMLDLVLFLLLSVLIIHRMVKIFVTRRRNQAGSRLHVKIVSVFTLLAIAPSIVVAVFAGLFYYFGVQAWFSDRVRTVVNESLVVAQSYLREHQQVLRADALAMASDLNREAFRLNPSQPVFGQLVVAQASVRSLNEAIVFDSSGKIVARSGLSFSLSLEPITPDMLERARKGEVVLRVSDDDNRVRALLRLDNFIDLYLFVGRLVEPKVLAHMAATQGAVNEYKEMEARRLNLQITLAVIFTVAAGLLLLVAVWFGLNFASQLVRPIGGLIGAAERVRAGDLTARVSDEAGTENELALLSRAFNRMTSQLENQRNELVDANRLLDYRRRFTEAVLATVPAGVIGMDARQNINLINHAAADLFHLAHADDYIGRPLAALVPELDEMLRLLPPNTRLSEGEIEIHRSGQPHRTLLVRVAAEISGAETRSYVVTFDDISDLLSAQRKAAWADVARRIAHEIKNPLTPIQLSAERLQRRYLQEIKSDPETFVSCIETITRQVDDIGRMVDEFSAFARMPVPVMAPQDIVNLCRQALFMQSGRADIAFEHNLTAEPLPVLCDSRQIAQALTNLLKNAIEAIDGRAAPASGLLPPGRIALQLMPEPQQITLRITDNGKGLPVEERNRLTEPYVTTRTKGTGLGLAIVKKIMEDHGGLLRLDDNPAGGVIITITLPRAEPGAATLVKQKGIAHTPAAESILVKDETAVPAPDEEPRDVLPDQRTAQA